MSEIELKRANVVKRVDSEDKAKALEAKGFVRTDGTVANKTESNAASEAVINELKEQLLKAGKSDEALTHLELSQDILIHNQDYASLNTVYFYLGKLYWQRGNRTKSLHYLNKVDSLVNKFRFITPEIREGYEYLIKDAKQSRNSKKQLYYTNQLLKADSIINADFAMLSS